MRRIGQNELSAIQACLAYVDAQNEYAEKDRTGAGINTYAQRIISNAGKNEMGSIGRRRKMKRKALWVSSSRRPGQGFGVKAGSGRIPFHGYYLRS